MSKRKQPTIFQPKGKKANTTDGFENFISRIGVAPGRQNNTLSAGFYQYNMVTHNRPQLEAAYRGAWVAGAMVDTIAEDMTRAGITISTNKAADTVKQIHTAMSKLQIWQSYCSLIKWGRLYGGSMGVLQIKGQNLDTPLDPSTVGQGQFQGISVFDRWAVNPSLGEVIQEGPEMGMPMYYDIVTANTPTGQTQGEVLQSAKGGGIRVHHSRVIRMIGIELPYWQAIVEQMWGESVLERIWDRLICFDTATMSAGSLIDRANLRTVKIEGLRQIIAGGGPAYQALLMNFEMIRQFQTNEGLTLLDKNDEASADSYTFSGLSDMLIQFGQQLSGGTEIPLVRLFGQSPAGLGATGESELRMYYDQINAKQESKMRNPIELVLKVMYQSVLGIPMPDDLEFDFTSLWQPNPVDKANIAKTNAETIIGVHDAGLASQATSMREIRQETGIFTNISNEEIDAAEIELPPFPEPAPEPAPTASGPPVPSLDTQTVSQRVKSWFKSKGA